jgi:hypothetical protein
MKKLNLFLLMVVLVLALVLAGCARAEVVEETPEPTVVVPTVTAVPPTDVPPTEVPVLEEPEVVEPEVELVVAVTPPPAEEAVDEEEAALLDLLAEKVGTCHALNFVLRQNKTREEWSTTIDRMIGYGAPINAQEKEIIINFLVSRQP